MCGLVMRVIVVILCIGVSVTVLAGAYIPQYIEDKVLLGIL